MSLRFYQFMPSAARQVIVQQLPTPRVSFVMPATERMIRRYQGTGGAYEERSSLKKEIMQIPDLLYVWDPINRIMNMYIIRVVAGRIMCRALRLANVHCDLMICWGGEGMSQRWCPREAITSYWESTFNDDLTPYRYGSVNRAAYNRGDDVIVPQWIVDARYRMELTQIRGNPMTQDRRKADKRIDFIKARIQRVNEILGMPPSIGSAINRNGIKYILNKQEADGFMSVSLYRRVQCLSRVSSALSEAMRRTETLLYELRKMADDIADNMAGVVDSWLFTEGDNEIIEEFYKNSKALAALTLRYGALDAVLWVKSRMSHQMSIRLEQEAELATNRGFRQWEGRKRREVRQKWWDGEWQTYGKEEDFTEYILGTEQQLFANGCHGIFCASKSGTDYFSKVLPTAAWSTRRDYVGVTFKTKDPSTVLGLVGGLPFIGSVGKRNQITWAPYDDGTKRLLNEIEEVFA